MDLEGAWLAFNANSERSDEPYGSLEILNKPVAPRINCGNERLTLETLAELTHTG